MGNKKPDSADLQSVPTKSIKNTILLLIPDSADLQSVPTKSIKNTILLLIPNKKACSFEQAFQKKGGDILSHITAVPSAQSGLTSLFGMGRGEPRRNNHLKF